MKQFFLSIALASATFAFSQKKEIAAAFKAIEAGDMATANAQISAADAAIGGKTYLLEPSVLEQYYFAKGASLLKSGNAEGAVYLSKISDLGKSKVYVGKDANKNKVYYVGKQAADASGISGLKEETYVTTLTPQIAGIINPILTSTNKKAIDAFNAQNYDLAGDKFVETYNLLKSVGQINGQMLYNAGLSYAKAEKNQKAIDTFNQLISMNYTGVETSYTAKNKKTGQVEALDKTTWDVLKKNSDYSDFKVETTPSIEKEIYETQAALLAESGKPEDALAFIDKALLKFPGNARLLQLQGNIYFKTGKTDQFINNLKEQIAKNPNDATNWFNLGVLQSKNPETVKDAENSYKKAIELNPQMKDAYINMTYIKMGDDEKAVGQIEAARKAGKTEQFNKLLEERRARFVSAIPYAEKWQALDPNDLDAILLLKTFYTSAKNEAKFNEMKVKEAALKGKK